MKYGGSFIKGLSGGMSSGLSMIMELKWKKKANEELEKQKEEAKMAINELIADPANQEYLSSGIQTDPYSATGIQLTTSLLAWNTDMGKYMGDIQKAINEGNHKEKDRLMEEFKIRVEAIKSLNLEGASVNPDFGFNIASPEGLKMINMQNTYKETPATVKPYDMTRQMGEAAGFDMPGVMDVTPTKPTDTQVKLAEIDKLTFLSEERRNQMKVDMLSKADSATDEKVKAIKAAGGTNEDIVKALGGGVIGPEPTTTTTPTAFKTLQDIKDSFKNVKTKAEYDSALASYSASKEAKTSDWTPPFWEDQLTDLIKRVESAIWADYVNKDGKLKSKGDAEEYNANLQHYLRLIEEARKAGIDVSQFQAFIPYKALYYGIGDPLVTKESW